MSQEHRAARARPQALLFGRFQVLEELGSGGFGRVLRCTDTESGEVVALKELHRFGADALLRFKKEFRVLADVQHPNLVRLGELFEGEGHWGFSLEYVQGSDALTWVQAADNDSDVDEGKLRRLLTELVHGLSAIHALGLLHRDVKPANIRVTPKGRVVLLDFGLATHLSGGQQTSEASAVGTVAYMAPEQANAQKLTPAADWYSLGVLLYEALTGQLPFEGTALQILMAKHHGVLTPPSELVPSVAADLEAICLGLLSPKIEERLDGEAVLAMLGSSSSSLPAARTSRAHREELFVGRVAELAALEAQIERTLKDGIGLTLIEGESGIGKSAIAKHFATAFATQHPEVLVLSGRCHAAEQVGYKAFDGVVDELSRFLKGLSNDACAARLPDDAHLLPVLFPVLERVPAIAQAKRHGAEEKIERYPLFQAFMELLRRIARERPLVLVVDDLQWADEASLVLLKALLDSTRAPRLFLLATVRPLDTLDDTVGEGLLALATHERVSRLPLGPLAEAETRTLIARLSHEQEDASVVTRLVRDAQGHPLFVNELVRHARAGNRDTSQAGLDAAIQARVGRLDLMPRLALELSAVASAPMPASVLRAALRAHPEPFREALGTLRIEKLLHTVRRNETVVYHDRIREAVLRTLPADLASAHHRRLAEAFGAEPTAEPDRLARHWLGCGETQKAAPLLEQAAKKAEQGGAFERAVEHYRALLGLEGVVRERAQEHTLRLALSDALAGAGRCAESARVLLGALEGANEEEALELTIRAAQRFLQASEIEEGLVATQRACELLGLPWPRTKVGLVAGIVWNRALMAARGFKIREPDPARVGPKQRTQLEALLRLLAPLMYVDLLRATQLSSHHARLALACRDVEHVAYALASEANLQLVQGASRKTVLALAATARAWRERANTPVLEANEEVARGISDCFWGKSGEAEAHFERAMHLYETSCPGATWELAHARGCLLTAWFNRGRLKRYAQQTQEWLDEADARGDRGARVLFVVVGFGCVRHILADQPARGMQELNEAMSWSPIKNAAAHEFQAAAAGSLLSTYEGDARAYWTERWPGLEKALFFRMPVARDVLVVNRLQGLLSVAAKQDKEALHEATRVAGKVARCRSGFAGLLGAFQQAQLAWLEGDREQAAQLARGAAIAFEQGGMDAHARFASVLAARAENAPDAYDREQRLLDWLSKEGFVRPDKALLWLLPAARTWR